MIVALEASISPPSHVLLRGDAKACAAWQRELERHHRPSLHVLNLAGQDDLPGALVAPGSVDAARATAWLCRGSVCLPPVTSREALEALIR